MHAALIPPKGYEHTALWSHFHLMLAQVVHDDYFTTYSRAKLRNDYIIMDNGAAEGKLVDMDTLINAACALDVSEVVLPDAMHHAAETITMAKDAFNMKPSIGDLGFSIMGIIQGDHKTDIPYCVDSYRDMHGVTTLGIPRHWIRTLGDVYARFNICAMLQANGMHERFEVHLLGTSTAWPGEIQMLSRTYPWVRSVDTSMPYNWTMAGLRLPEPYMKNQVQAIARPNAYFEVPRTLDEDLLEANCQTYLEWAQG